MQQAEESVSDRVGNASFCLLHTFRRIYCSIPFYSTSNGYKDEKSRVPSRKTTSNNNNRSANPLLFCFFGMSRLVYASCT